MATKRPSEPIAPATIPGQPLDPKIPPEQIADSDEHEDRDESDEERQARESEKAFDREITRTPPG